MWQKIQQIFWQWRGVAIAVPTVAGLTIALRLFGSLQLLEWAALDCFFRWRPSEPTDPRIVLVAISESDIRKIKSWPISDRTLAQLLQKIKNQNPRVIGLDLYRDLPVEPGHAELTQIFKSTPNLIGIEKVTGDNYGISVSPPPSLSPDRVGAVDLLLDQDGKVRRALLSLKPENRQADIDSLAVHLALQYLEKEGVRLEIIDAEKFIFGLGKAVFRRLEKNDGGYVGVNNGGYQILFNFRNHECRGKVTPCPLFETVSMSDVLEGRISPDLMRDRVVLIGSKAASIKDVFFTPYSNNYLTAPAGVEIHADLVSFIISAALDGRPLIKVWPELLEWAWIFLWSGIGATASWTLLRSRWKATGILLSGFILVGGCYLAFLASWWIPLVPPFLAMVASGAILTAYIAYLEREDRETVMNLLGQHVSPKIAQAVWRDRHQLLKEGQLSGQKITATVLFTDLKGFTNICEQTDAETLLVWLNQYMRAMSQVVLDRNGVIDKFIGDAVMAVFGVPIPRATQEEIAADAAAAVSCALAMSEKLEELNQQWQAQGMPTASMRVGVSTGQVVAGSLGSRQRLNYTVLGDSVNVAARLESYDKTLDGGLCRILISEETYNYIENQFPTQFIAEGVQLKGRTKPVKIYQVLYCDWNNETGEQEDKKTAYL
ncbi:MAG: adenylate/guanylate cyclase domain-containing protein [Oscillatoria sp. SIO1A7]|nr:adenylate/guanylate cyclase domain-containing protein [Oscillatoria sp. SIO1A7]